MTAQQALKLLARQAPCPHHTIDLRLGDGKTWAHCEDCGSAFEQARLAEYRNRALEFDGAVATLQALVDKEDTTPMAKENVRFSVAQLRRMRRMSLEQLMKEING